MLRWLLKSYTYNAALSYSFFIAVQLNQTGRRVKMAWILYSQSHIPILPKQLEHEVISHISYGLTWTKTINLSKKKKQRRNKFHGLGKSKKYVKEKKKHKCVTISYCCMASSSLFSWNRTFPSIFLRSAAPIRSSTVISLRAFPCEFYSL